METTKPAGDIYFSVKKRTQLSDYSKPRQFKAKVMPRKIKNEIQLKQPRAMGTPKDFALVPKLQNQATKKLQAVANKRKAMQQAREAPPIASLLQAQELQKVQNKNKKNELDRFLKQDFKVDGKSFNDWLTDQPNATELVKLPLNKLVELFSHMIKKKKRTSQQMLLKISKHTLMKERMVVLMDIYNMMQKVVK